MNGHASPKEQQRFIKHADRQNINRKPVSKFIGSKGHDDLLFRLCIEVDRLDA